MNKIERQIKISDTLVDRISRGVMTNNPEIVNWSPEQLGTLDYRTTQWQTMAYLLRDRRKVPEPKYKLKVTYDAVEHWEESNEKEEAWKARKDPTLFNQAKAFLDYMQTGKIIFSPEQAEDYCFARAFDIVDNKILETPEGKRMFESVEGHETDRIIEMEIALNEAACGKIISSKDHRVVQAYAMMQLPYGEEIKVKYKSVVNKSWPKFWEFMDYAKQFRKKV